MDTYNGFVGDIKYSILEPKIFKKLHSGWELLMGQNLSVDTALAQLGVTKLPDARGVFLRGLNVSDEFGKHNENGDPEIDRSVGSYQPDDFKSHNHLQATTASVIAGGPTSTMAGVSRGGAIQDVISTAYTGSKETRPRNIALYIYVKVN